jgi:hypothetical protein
MGICRNFWCKSPFEGEGWACPTCINSVGTTGGISEVSPNQSMKDRKSGKLNQDMDKWGKKQKINK